jgi:hypothetical protein
VADYTLAIIIWLCVAMETRVCVSVFGMDAYVCLYMALALLVFDTRLIHGTASKRRDCIYYHDGSWREETTAKTRQEVARPILVMPVGGWAVPSSRLPWVDGDG